MKAWLSFLFITLFLVFSLNAQAAFYNSASNNGNNTNANNNSNPSDDDPFGQDSTTSHPDNPDMQPTDSPPDVGDQPDPSSNPGLQPEN